MKRFWTYFAIAVLGLSAYGWCADLTDASSTSNNQYYNRGYRDLKDGTNSPTMDVTSANSYALIATTATVKTSGGILESMILLPGCNYFIVDSSFNMVNSNYATYISTYNTVNTQVPLNPVFRARVANGITVGIGFSTCTATVSYR